MKHSHINIFRKKRIFTQLLAGCLFAVFILNSIFSFLIFEVKRKLIRHEIKHNILNKLPDNQLFIFSFNGNTDKDEFEYNGVMYDVVRQKIVDGKVLLLCFQDKKETELNRRIESSVKNDLANTPIKKTQQKLIIFLKLSFISFQEFTFCFLKKLLLKSSSYLSTIIFPAFINVLYPPPDFKKNILLFY